MLIEEQHVSNGKDIFITEIKNILGFLKKRSI